MRNISEKKVHEDEKDSERELQEVSTRGNTLKGLNTRLRKYSRAESTNSPSCKTETSKT